MEFRIDVGLGKDSRVNNLQLGYCHWGKQNKRTEKEKAELGGTILIKGIGRRDPQMREEKTGQKINQGKGYQELKKKNFKERLISIRRQQFRF